MGQRKSYDKEFKQEVVKLIKEGNITVSSVAKDLDIPKTTITQWIKQDEKHKGNLRSEDDEIRKLKLKIADLEEENEILKKGSSHLHQATEVIFKFIYDHRFKFRVQKMCQVLKVSRSGYYAWLKRPKSKRDLENEKLLEQIKRVHKKSRNIYGSIRITKQLNHEGIKCGRNRVYRLMKLNNIQSIMKRKFKATTNSKHSYPVAPNLLNQNFTVEKPNQAWVTDIAYIATKEGWLYLAIILDLYDPKVVGWSTMTQQLVINALNNAVSRRKPTKGLIHHSDRGSQYASKAYQSLLKSYGMKASMSRKGNCYDNACAESFFGTLKTEMVYFNKYETRAQAKSSIFEYIELFYNTERLHSSLNYKSPKNYENQRKVA
nr:IS3 family transposase [Clostridium formicaceticum]